MLKTTTTLKSIVKSRAKKKMSQTTTMGFTGDFNWEEGMRAIKRERLDGGAGREEERE